MNTKPINYDFSLHSQAETTPTNPTEFLDTSRKPWGSHPTYFSKLLTFSIALLSVVCLSQARAQVFPLLTDPGFNTPLTHAPIAYTTAYNTPVFDTWGIESGAFVPGYIDTSRPLPRRMSPKEGNRMLRMNSIGGVVTQTIQFVDLTATNFQNAINAGNATIDFAACFNVSRDAGGALGYVALRFFNTLAPVGPGSAIGTFSASNPNLDNVITSWESIALNTVPVPLGTLRVGAEVGFRNAELNGLPGFVDLADMNLTIVPEPSSLVLGLMSLIGLGGMRRRVSLSAIVKPRVMAMVAIGLLTIFTAATSQAQIGPGVSAGPPTLIPLPVPTLHFTIPQGPNGDFTLGDPANPIPVSYSPTAGPFEKWLAPNPDQDGSGNVDISDFLLFLANPILNLNEHLIVGPGPAWTDWHEEILTPDWSWGTVQITTPGPPPGPTNLIIQNSGTKVDFFFDPIASGTPVDIRKQLFFQGAGSQQMLNDFLAGKYMIQVSEYPTVPEPSSLALIGIGFASVLGRRRRREDVANPFCRTFAAIGITVVLFKVITKLLGTFLCERKWNRKRLTLAHLPLCISYLSTIAVGMAFGNPALAQWTATLLQPNTSVGWGIRSGQQVGAYSTPSLFTHAAMWNGSSSSFVDLHPAGFNDSLLWDSDGTSQVGWVQLVGAGNFRAALWHGTSAVTQLHPAGASYSEAYAVSGNQQVGMSRFGGSLLGEAGFWTGTAASWTSLHPTFLRNSQALGTDGVQQVGVAVRLSGLAEASLWSGTAASWVNLAPVGALDSRAFDVDGGQQVGSARFGGFSHPGLWTGSASSWVDLLPTGMTSGEAWGVDQGYQVGVVASGGPGLASLWNGTAASWVDLHSFLPSNYTESFARAVEVTNSMICVVGTARDNNSGTVNAVLWCLAIPEPSSISLAGASLIFCFLPHRHGCRISEIKG